MNYIAYCCSVWFDQEDLVLSECYIVLTHGDSYTS